MSKPSLSFDYSTYYVTRQKFYIHNACGPDFDSSPCISIFLHPIAAAGSSNRGSPNAPSKDLISVLLNREDVCVSVFVNLYVFQFFLFFFSACLPFVHVSNTQVASSGSSGGLAAGHRRRPGRASIASPTGPGSPGPRAPTSDLQHSTTLERSMALGSASKVSIDRDRLHRNWNGWPSSVR